MYLSITCKITLIYQRILFSPNPGFMDQLGLYEKMNCSADNSNALYRLYQLGILVDHSKPAHHWDSICTLLHEDNTSGTTGKGVKCRNCRKVLFSHTSIVTHNDPQGQLCLRQNGCSGVVYVAPLRWMSEMIGDEHGKVCRNIRMDIKVYFWLAFNINKQKREIQIVTLKDWYRHIPEAIERAFDYKQMRSQNYIGQPIFK